MKLNKRFLQVFFICFTALLFIVNFSKTTTVKAYTTTTDKLDAAEKVMRSYDGITNWTPRSETSSNQIGDIYIGHDFSHNTDISLGYTFGAARNSNGVVQSGDKTVSMASSATTSSSAEGLNPIQTNSKINIFLKNGNKYYGILHQGDKSYISSDNSSNPQLASDTSIDFVLLSPGESTDAKFYKSDNVLVQLGIFDNKYSKQFYTGTDSNGNVALKLVGYYGPTGVYVEIVLRAAPNGAPVVQRELYVYNPSDSNTTRKFNAFYGEDTALSPNMDTTVDNVPMKAIGGGQGLYLESGSTFSPASKLFVTNNVPDGFDDFMGRVFSNPSNWSVKGKQGYGSSSNMSAPKLSYVSGDIATTNHGDTYAAKDSDLLVGNNNGTTYKVVDTQNRQDTAYSLRWNETTLAPGQVAHFASDIGATVSGVPVPIVTKTYKNLTSTNGKNNVGDTLQFTLKVRNNGYNSSWTISKILDSLPTGLTVKKGSITSSTMNGVDYTPDNANGDGVIKDNEEAIYTFDATINNEAPYNLTNGNLTNEVQFTGHTTNYTDSKTYKDSVKIPVEIPAFKYRFTKLVKNETTDPSGAYSSETTGQKGDIIDYRIDFTSNGSATFNGGNFADTLPAGLKLVDGSVTLNGDPKNGLNFSIGNLNNSQVNRIQFQAEVTGLDASTASNTAYINNVVTSSGQLSQIATEAPAIVNIVAAPKTIALDKVPTSIDFGSVNPAGFERTLSNVKTDGDLIITHGEDSPFQVGVSYDNSDDATAIKNQSTNEKLIQDDGQSLFFNQFEDNGTTDHWVPLSSDSVPIKSDGFKGTYNKQPLTKYIGKKKWKLRVPAGSKAGNYSGKITWSLYDTPQN